MPNRNQTFDLFSVFAGFARDRGFALSDPTLSEEFIAGVRKDLATALGTPTLLYGQRTQNMFEALIVALDEYQLLKVEDAGRVYGKTAYRLPDFRVVLTGGDQWLIEVKNFYSAQPGKQTIAFSRGYIGQLEAYAALMKCPLKLAVYWARWGIWTLVEPADLRPSGDKLQIEMANAIQLNLMAELGDRMIETAPPLRLQLVADQTKPRTIAADGQAQITISRVRTFVGEVELVDKADQEIAWVFMQFGDWEDSEPTAIMNEDAQEAIEFGWTPRQQNNVGFEMIGTLSSMFSRYYAMKTLQHGAVTHTEAELTPGWFKPLVNYQRRSFPLWHFVLRRPEPAGP